MPLLAPVTTTVLPASGPVRAGVASISVWALSSTESNTTGLRPTL